VLLLILIITSRATLPRTAASAGGYRHPHFGQFLMRDFDFRAAVLVRHCRID
jgi:hypothetical protein